MRCVVNAKALATALKFAAKAIQGCNVIPIVGNVLIEASGTSLAITGTDLDQQHVANVHVLDLAEPSATTVPGARFANLIEKLPPDANVAVRTEGDQALVTCGRGHWKLLTLPPEDFPVLGGPSADAAMFTLEQAAVRRLVRRVEHAISSDEMRYYLNGVYLHRLDGQLVAVSTDGRLLALHRIDCDPGHLSIIVPKKLVAFLDEMAGHGEVEIRPDGNKIALRAGSYQIVSKLIDGTFPDYARLLPSEIENSVEVSSADLLASIGRHKAAAEKDTGIGLAWVDDVLKTCLSRNEAGAIEELAAISSAGSGRVAASANYLLDTLEALDAKAVVIAHDGRGQPIRITAANEPESVMIVMPLTWM
jgi:DNA polymerase-3 subunit beta